MNGRAYAWDATKGLDPSVALEVEGFIRKKAWGYSKRATMAGLEFEDLVQEGLAGALKAAARYNPEAGANYLTYAAWWIDAAMKDALTHSIVRTPEGEAFAHIASLDAPIGGEEGAEGPTFLEQRHDEDQLSAHDLSVAAEDRARVRKALPKLNSRDREALARHLGLDGYHPEPLQMVAKQMGVTRQRVGQIVDRARKDLRRALLP
jgi:RNA polymerase sigma factor (sigma-70 family)